MEKRNYINKVINSLRNNQNEVLHDAKSILNKQKKFYEDLYSSKLQADADPTLCDSFLSNIGTKLSQEQSDTMEGIITE